MATAVLVPIDESDAHARALPVAVALAGLSGGAVHLVHVSRVLTPREAGETALVGLDAAAVSGERSAEQRLTAIAEELGAATGRAVTWDVLRDADAAAALVRDAAARDALLVVMATRAAGPVGRAIVGSVADRVVRECPRPVVLVPPHADYMRGRQVRVARVLVPLDGSALALRALDFLLQLPRAASLEYVLLTVVPPDADRAAATAQLEAAGDRVRARGARVVEIAVAEAGDAASAIVAAIREALVDAVAMSTRGEGGLRRMVLGSVAEGVVRASEVPVLLLTPATLAAQ